MNPTRFWHVFWLDFKYHIRRPLFIILLLILGLTAWGVSKGAVQISAGDAAVGGKKAWLTSEHANAFMFSLLTTLYFGFFVAVGAGLSIPHDDEIKVGEILHATPLRVREYVWGKFFAVLGAFTGVLMLQMFMTMFLLHMVPNPDADKIIGPFSLMNYLKPALMFGFPTILFVAGITFAIGEFTRKPILVFFFPVALLLFLLFFLWDWSPTWLDPRINKLLMFLDPAGFRWMNETILKVDKGVEYYNSKPVAYDFLFLASRVFYSALGIGSVLLAQRHFSLTLRGTKALPKKSKSEQTNAPARVSYIETAPLSSLSMMQRVPKWISQALTVARFEFKGLLSSPGMYLFIPLILLQTIPAAYYRSGPFGTFVMVTSGFYAMGTKNVLMVCVSLLLLFYTAESITRERATGLWPIVHSTPMKPGAWLTGKALANTFVAFVIMAGAFLGYLLLLVIQGKGGLDLVPFFVVWIGLLGPTFFAWTAFVILLLCVTRSKYLTYALALGTLIGTGWAANRGYMNWVFNWNIWSATGWTDMGFLEPNAYPLLLNRILWMCIAGLVIALTVKIYERREFDATRIVHRLYPMALLKTGLRLLPFATPAFVLAITLAVMVANGSEGKKMRNKGHDYWKQNLATWKDQPIPAIVSADCDLKLEPIEHTFALKGTYDLANIDEEPMRQVAITLGHHIKEAKWTMDGKEYKPEDKTHLFIFTPEKPLAKGDHIKIGFDYAGAVPGGISKNGGGASEFIEPSGVVLQGWSPVVFPVVGWQEGIGVEGDKNSYEPRVFPDDYYKGEVKSAFGSRKPFVSRMRIDVPKEYMANSNGELLEDKIEGDRRVVQWATDHPIMMFNVVAGKWDVKRGEGTAIFYHPEHTYNLDELMDGLNGARKYYSEWFYPYPWKELKLSEFANLAGYAQGFPTDITFSEGIGFLTRSNFRGRAAFTVSAHEAAHQWWGNILVPGDGPGGNILSEGMAHYSTILLSEQVKGLQARIEFCKRVEESYGDSRVVDSERAMVKIQGDKPGDTTVTYDKGGFVFYMLHNLMGREAMFAGLQAFIKNHLDNPDHALLEDFIEEMRPFAPDQAAYDEFVQQWFHGTTVPMYQFIDVKKEKEGVKWIVTGKVKNAGTGKSPVEVAALFEEKRFKEQTEEEAAKGPAEETKSYKDVRQVVTLGADESADIRIECDFEPELVTVDPDVTVLMLNRKNAVVRL